MAHIICVDIAHMHQQTCETFYTNASPERRQRAQRYLFEQDKRRCVTADALLRYAVCRVLGTTAFTVKTNDLGKPSLDGVDSFTFNLSHSGRWVVIAYGDTAVGIDVEKIKEKQSLETVTRHFFTKDEQEFVLCGKEMRTERFYQVWTAKESYLKYLGTGLSKALDSFSVFTLETPRLHSRRLEGGYYVTLCTEDREATMETMTADQLLQRLGG